MDSVPTNQATTTEPLSSWAYREGNSNILISHSTKISRLRHIGEKVENVAGGRGWDIQHGCTATERPMKLKKLRFFVACAHPTNPRGQQQRFNSANVPHGNRWTEFLAAVYNISTQSWKRDWLRKRSEWLVCDCMRVYLCVLCTTTTKVIGKRRGEADGWRTNHSTTAPATLGCQIDTTHHHQHHNRMS